MKKCLIILLFNCLIIFVHSPLYAIVINASIPDTSASVGDLIYVPVNVDDLTASDISAFNMIVRYDSTILRWEGYNVSGTLSSIFGNPAQNPNYGEVLDDNNNYVASLVKISGASSNEVKGGGIFIYLGFTVLNNLLGTSTNIILDQINLLTFGVKPGINILNGKFSVSEKREKGIVLGVDSVFNFSDSTEIGLNFSTGDVIDKTVEVTNLVNYIPKKYAEADTVSTSINYYEITSTIEGSFSADLKFIYTDEVLSSKGINENNLVIAKYNNQSLSWEALNTTIDTILNVAVTEINSFSLWTIADINDSSFHGSVELVSFSIKNYTKDMVHIIWEVDYEINNYGFEIQKSFDNNLFETIGFVEGHGTTYNSYTYEFIDNNIQSYKYYYRLKLIGFNGKHLSLNTIYIPEKHEENLTAGVDSVTFNFLDNTKISLNFTSGDINNKTIRISDYGTYIPDQYVEADTVTSAVRYYEISSTIESSFNAQLKFFYTDEMLASSGLPEKDIIIAKYDSVSLSWKALNTIIDTVLNTAIATTDSLSFWVLADRNDSLFINDPATPVELMSFNLSEFSKKEIRLFWEVSGENLGFEIHQSFDELNFNKIAFIPANGISAGSFKYEYIHKVINEEKNKNCFYRLKYIDFDGSYGYSKTLHFKLAMPVVSKLYNAYPNPFNSETVIKYYVSEPEIVSIKIYNIVGKMIKTLIKDYKLRDYYSIRWDGRNDYGIIVSSGIYIYVLEVGKFKYSKKLSYIK